MVDYPSFAKRARRDILTMIHKAQTSHIASNFSVIDIAIALYELLEPNDRIVWSKGWAAATAYYFNAKYGLGPQDAVDKFPHEPYYGLAETTVPGIHVNGGSVGHGLSVALGMALAKQRAGEQGKVYCIMSDGELNEGAVWEAAMLAGHHKPNLVAIVDQNHWQAMGRTEEVVNVDYPLMFAGAQWATEKVDGHNHYEVYRALDEAHGPHIIFADTVKGKGVSFMEDALLFHYKNVDDETYERAMKELC